MPKPSDHDFEEAVLWLEECDASKSMRSSCLAVAQWIKDEATKRENEKAIKVVARETGVSAAVIRKRMAASVAKA